MVSKSGLFMLSLSTVKISGKHTCPALLGSACLFAVLFGNYSVSLYLFSSEPLYRRLAVIICFMFSKRQQAVSQMFQSFMMMGAHEPGGSAAAGTAEDPSYPFYLPYSTNYSTAIRYMGGKQAGAQDKEVHLKHR